MTNKELLDHILKFASLNKISDLHFQTNSKLKIRDKNGQINTLEKITINSKEFNLPNFGIENIRQFIYILAGERGYEKFKLELEIDSSYAIDNGNRFRVNCYMDTNGYSIALRAIPNKIPSLEELGLGEQIKKLCDYGKGLILVTGPTGSGKSTNLAAMIDYINKNYNKHIITIEDPVEFAFKSEKSLINQREIGNHTQSFAKATRAVLREDPDVIMVGEMRDPETIKAAITLAETGHLVFSTLHTNDSVQTIDRIIDIFPGNEQKQIRMQLAMSLNGILSQRLITKQDNNGKIPAREILINNDAIKNLIITGKTHQIYSVLEVGKDSGMILMDKYLIALYKKQLISKENLIALARDKEAIEMLFNN